MSSNKKIFFFSDVHLGLKSNPEEKLKEQRVLKFIDNVIKHGSELFILGDLFDFWFEYKNAIPKNYYKLIEALNKVTNSGIPVHFVLGNHDYWTKDFFTESLGIKVYKKPITIVRSGKKIHLHHGDGLALYDKNYKLMTSIIRNKLFIWCYSQLPANLGLAIGSKLSQKSKVNHTTVDRYGETEGMINYSTSKFIEGCDVVIMGHRHQYLVKNIGNGLYINLGDWITYNSYATFDGKIFKLEFWENN